MATTTTSKKNYIVFDIETGPLPDADLRKQFAEPQPKAELLAALEPFDPASVKYGNTKDPAKRAEKLEAAQLRWAEAREAAQQELATLGNRAWAAFLADAALSALTGRVVAIGYQCRGTAWITGLSPGDSQGEACNGKSARLYDTEGELLGNFWDGVRTNWTFVGHNIHSFDLPFLVQRSRLLGVPVPSGIRVQYGRYWSPQFADTMPLWSCGGSRFVGLDAIAKAAGHSGKNGSGAEFARLWFGSPEEHQRAIDYSLNDLAMSQMVAEMCDV